MGIYIPNMFIKCQYNNVHKRVMYKYILYILQYSGGTRLKEFVPLILFNFPKRIRNYIPVYVEEHKQVFHSFSLIFLKI